MAARRALGPLVALLWAAASRATPGAGSVDVPTVAIADEVPSIIEKVDMRDHSEAGHWGQHDHAEHEGHTDNRGHVEHGGRAERDGHAAADGPAEGGGHEGHAGHPGHGHQAASEAMQTTSYLLIGFLVTNFLLFRLVTYRDANVRSYTWKLLSSTVSIYLAVVLDSSITSTILSGFSMFVDDDERVMLRVEAACSMCLFVLWFAALTWATYKLRTRYIDVYAMTTIGGHITAFAGIGAVEATAELGPKEAWFCSCLLVIVVVTLFGVRVASWKVRHQRLGVEAEERKREGRLEEEEEEEEEEPPESGDATLTWFEHSREGEDEACAIIQSFVVERLILVLLFGAEKADPLAQHSTSDIRMLAVAGVVVLALLVASTYQVKLLDISMDPKAGSSAKLERAVAHVQGTIAMTGSWLSMHLFLWVSLSAFAVDHEFGEVIAAGILTFCAILGIIFLDMVADKLGALSRRKAQHGSDVVRRDSSSMEVLSDTRNVEKAVRTVINSIALTVGLSWEHAFHAATTTAIATTDVGAAFPIAATVVVAVASYALMAPVWLHFLARMASKTVRHHEDLMKASQKQC